MKKEQIRNVLILASVFIFLIIACFIQTKRIENRDSKINELKTAYLSEVNFNDILEMQKDSLIKNVKTREKVIYRTKIVVKKLSNTADSSYIEFIKDTTLKNCTNALIDCRVLNDSLDSENNLLTQQNSDLADLVNMDSLMIERYGLALNSAQKNNIILSQKIANFPKVKALQSFVIIGSDTKFTTQKIQVGVDIYRKVLVGISGNRFHNDFSYTIDLGYKF